MLFREEFLAGIGQGTITLAFRRWRRPSVRSGGTLLTSVGQLEITSVRRVSEDEISADEARRAGHPSVDALRDELDRRSDGDVYRIEIGAVRHDPRVALRDEVPADDSITELLGGLGRLDARAKDGAWTARVLEVIDQNPGVRAGDICTLVSMEKDAFKLNVRKLKHLGLTESLGTGYRLSPRGRATRRVWPPSA